MAAFRKRNNKWQAQIRIKGQAPRKKSFITKRDAESWARKVEAELEASAVRIDPRALERSTVCDLLERYRKEVTVAKRGEPPLVCRRLITSSHATISNVSNCA
jgi:hypothetical protein